MCMAVHPLPNEAARWKDTRQRPCIVLDWDDTLLPNTHLAMLGFVDEAVTLFALSDEHAKELAHVEAEVAAFLQTCYQLGECFIVTNGQEGWVERSCKRFMPQVYPLLSNCTVISARSQFEKLYPAAPVQWKVAAYSEILCVNEKDETPERSVYPTKPRVRQVLAMGDSEVDRTAIQYVAEHVACNVQLKSIKFLENPSMMQVRKQLNLTGGFLSQLCAHNEALDLVLSANMLR